MDKLASRSASSFDLLLGVCLGVVVSIKEIDFSGVEFWKKNSF